MRIIKKIPLDFFSDEKNEVLKNQSSQEGQASENEFLIPTSMVLKDKSLKFFDERLIPEFKRRYSEFNEAGLHFSMFFSLFTLFFGLFLRNFMHTQSFDEVNFILIIVSVIFLIFAWYHFRKRKDAKKAIDNSELLR